MALDLDHFAGPFRKVWNLIGRSFVVDRDGRQVVRPGSELGSLDWHAQKDDWERLAPLLAGAPDLYAAAERLAGKLEGPDARIVDGRIALDRGDVGELLDALDAIRAGAPRIRPPAEPPEDGADAARRP